MVALDRRWLARAGVDATRVAGVAGLSGPYDFHPFAWPSSRFSFGDWPRPEETQPIRYVHAGAPPLLLLTGTDDETVRPRNTMALAKALRAVGEQPQVVQIAGMAHIGPIVTLARPFDRDTRVGTALFAFLDEIFAGARPSSPVKPTQP
jgi:acetyl esterase/lipase